MKGSDEFRLCLTYMQGAAFLLLPRWGGGVRHFRLGGGAILMVLVVFEHFRTRGCCSRQFHAMGPISKIRLYLRHFRERG